MHTTRFSVIAIDDSEDDILILERLLSRAGVPPPLVAFHSGEQALASLAAKRKSNRNDVPHLVFLDNKMPGLCGLDVLRSLKEQTAFNHTAIVMLSSCDGGTDFDRAAFLGAQCYLEKHPTVHELAHVIEDACAFSHGMAGRAALFRMACNRLLARQVPLRDSAPGCK